MRKKPPVLTYEIDKNDEEPSKFYAGNQTQISLLYLSSCI